MGAITKSSEKMVAEQKKIEALTPRAAKFEGFGEKIKQFIESPLAGAKSAVTSLLTAMGPFGGAIAAGVTVLTGIALAGFEAAKSLGEYGVRIRDVELRTGLTAKEVGQFGFAARAAGQDTTIFERMMRGLSEAADDTSKEGEKARTTLQRIGVTMVDAHTGALKPTALVLSATRLHLRFSNARAWRQSRSSRNLPRTSISPAKRDTARARAT